MNMQHGLWVKAWHTWVAWNGNVVFWDVGDRTLPYSFAVVCNAWLHVWSGQHTGWYLPQLSACVEVCWPAHIHNSSLIISDGRTIIFRSGLIFIQVLVGLQRTGLKVSHFLYKKNVLKPVLGVLQNHRKTGDCLLHANMHKCDSAHMVGPNSYDVFEWLGVHTWVESAFVLYVAATAPSATKATAMQSMLWLVLLIPSCEQRNMR